MTENAINEPYIDIRNEQYLRWITVFILFAGTVESKEIQFNRDVRSILSNNCFQCHGPSGNPEADLRLDSFESATDWAIVPGEPEESSFVERILSDDTDEVMPPPDSHKKLDQKEKEILVEWIRSGAQYQDHWSLLPIRDFQSEDNVDLFVQRRLEKEELKSQPIADKLSLIRRATLDLTGLPPTPEEIDAFVADQSKDAWSTLVDRLLGSKRYGEHMARYWLDLVRYGDSHGIHADNYREMFFYRDWVIKAFNANQPFDEFCIDQIAGDLRSDPSIDHKIASGFNRLHISNSAGSALKEELHVNNVTDRVNAVGTVFLGLTLGCAACHDHKFDPISQAEYYQLFAFFNNMDGPPDNKGHKSPVPKLTLPTPDQIAAADALRAQIADAKGDQATQLRKQLAKLTDQFPATLIMKERKTPRPAYILVRGEYDNRGEQVERKTPDALPPMNPELPLDRMGFAHWLVDPNHPLLARVTVNRFWQQLFGVGLVKTSEDLGSQGSWPSHPELLDYLARTFIDSGWDVKALMRQIAMSKTYRQRSDAGAESYAADPENRLLARGPRFRMDAEMLRDQALFVSGRLNETMYGPSVKPPQPPGLWRSVSLPGTSRPDRFVPDKGSATVRRSVYTYWKRAYPPPTMTIFDAPNRETCIARRERTNTPLQALVLMNEQQFFESAQQLAMRKLADTDNDNTRLNRAMQRLTARPCSAEELELFQGALSDFRNHYRDQPDAEQRAWTMIISAMFNLDIVKNKQ